MSNQFKHNSEEVDIDEPHLKVTPEPIPSSASDGSATVFFKKLFTEGFVSKEDATSMLPFIVFLCVLGMIYIANSHMAISNIRAIDKLNKEVVELSSDFKSLKADLMFKSKLTEVAKKVDTLGIKELIEPPKKIVVNR